MKTPRISHQYYFLSFVLLLIVAGLACGTTITQELADAVQPTSEITLTPEVTTTEPVEILEIETPPDPLHTPLPTEPPPTPTSAPTPTPSPTPTPRPNLPVLVDSGFGQNGRSAGYAFVVNNPNEGFSIERTQYQIAAYDVDGIVVKTDSGYINLLLPDQTLGVGGDLWLEEGIVVDSIEIQLSSGQAVPTEALPPFTVENARYFASDIFSSRATGVVYNPYNRNFSDLRVSAVVYDSEGNIIGGGFSFLNFILADDATGVDISVNHSGIADKVEIYDTLSGLTALTSPGDSPAGSSEIRMIDYGFGQERRQAGWGMLVENDNLDYVIERSQYRITAFADDDTVVATDEGYINVLLPSQTLGIGGDLFLREGINVSRIEAQVLPGTFVASEAVPSFGSENAAFRPGQFSNRVVGQIVSPYNKDITNLRVSAIVFDGNGDIIGGGFTFLDFVPANGKAAVEVTVVTSQTPIQVELYGTVSILSDFKD